ncbi:MAG: helix-turn-helix domain containing protein, partial [Deltaproteobacteria bacterium]|nr:helix-turn-helix domain containing protein [Deltaproteobacteria bacterium]
MKTEHTRPKTIRPNYSIIVRVALRFNDNAPAVKTASMLCLTLSTVYFWWKRRSAEGPEGMKHRKRSRPTGGGRLMSPKQEESIR